MPLPRPRSTFARAVVPVLAGIAFFAALAGVTYLAAVIISDNPDNAEGRLLETTFRVGDVEDIAEAIADDGPIIFQELIRSGGLRTVVLYHEGDDPTRGWRVFFAYPDDREPSCTVDQVEQTATFVDCDGRRIPVEQLEPAAGVVPVVEDRETLITDLREAVAEATTTSVAGPSTSGGRS